MRKVNFLLKLQNSDRAQLCSGESLPAKHDKKDWLMNGFKVAVRVSGCFAPLVIGPLAPGRHDDLAESCMKYHRVEASLNEGVERK